MVVKDSMAFFIALWTGRCPHAILPPIFMR